MIDFGTLKMPTGKLVVRDPAYIKTGGWDAGASYQVCKPGESVKIRGKTVDERVMRVEVITPQTLEQVKSTQAAGVDSGQLVIFDEHWLSEWKEEEFQDIRRYKINGTENTLQFREHFVCYDDQIPPAVSGLGFPADMNKLIKDGYASRLKERPQPQYPFSYNACCQQSRPWGITDMFCCFSSGYGDGCYPVYIHGEKVIIEMN